MFLQASITISGDQPSTRGCLEVQICNVNALFINHIKLHFLSQHACITIRTFATLFTANVLFICANFASEQLPTFR